MVSGRYKFKTASGTEYEVDTKNKRVRRTNAASGMRRDNEWLILMALPNINIGYPAVMLLQPLGEGDATYRTTNIVTEVTPL